MWHGSLLTHWGRGRVRDYVKDPKASYFICPNQRKSIYRLRSSHKDDLPFHCKINVQRVRLDSNKWKSCWWLLRLKLLSEKRVDSSFIQGIFHCASSRAFVFGGAIRQGYWFEVRRTDRLIWIVRRTGYSWEDEFIILKSRRRRKEYCVFTPVKFDPESMTS